MSLCPCYSNCTSSFVLASLSLYCFRCAIHVFLFGSFFCICADDDDIAEELSGKLKSVLQEGDGLNDKGKVDKGL